MEKISAPFGRKLNIRSFLARTSPILFPLAVILKKQNLLILKHMKRNKIFLLILLLISNIIFSQKVTYSTNSNDERMSNEEWNNFKKLNDTKIYDLVDVKAKLKSNYNHESFEFNLKNMEKSCEIILNGTIEKDGTITGLNFSSITDQIISNNLRNFFREINSKIIFEAGKIKDKNVRSLAKLKLVLHPEINCIELFII